MSETEQAAPQLTEAGRRLSGAARVLEEVRTARAAVIALHTVHPDDLALREAHWYMTRAYNFMNLYTQGLEREVAGL